MHKISPKFLLLFLSLVLIVVFLTACEDDYIFGPDYSTVPPQFFAACTNNNSGGDDEDNPRNNWPCGIDSTSVTRHDLIGDVKSYVVEEGEGDFIMTERDLVLARYTGWNHRGEIFGSTWQNGFTGPGSLNFDLPSSGNITGITGLKLGIIGMTPGEKRTIIVPPDLGITSSTSRFRGDTLIIDFELVEIID